MPTAVQISRFGGPEVLEIVDVPMPQPAPGQARVRVATAGVNPAYTKLRAGARPGLSLPATLGTDLAGTIDALGDAVSSFRVGDHVLGSAPVAACAQNGVASVRDLVSEPAELPWTIAGSLAVVATTAYRLLTQLKVSRGETLLIHGASCGVGLMATQLARRKGARVLGTAAASNHALLRVVGATPVSGFPQETPRWTPPAPYQRHWPPCTMSLDVSIWRTYPLAEVAAAHAASETRHPPARSSSSPIWVRHLDRRPRSSTDRRADQRRNCGWRCPGW